MQLPLIVRLVITIYDATILVILFAIISIPLVIFLDVTTASPLHTLYLTCLYVITFLYYVGMWKLCGQTLAMKFWKTTLKNKNSEPITWKQATIRFMVALVSWGFAGLGFIWMLFRKDRATWHDLASGTCLSQHQKSETRPSSGSTK